MITHINRMQDFYADACNEIISKTKMAVRFTTMYFYMIGLWRAYI